MGDAGQKFLKEHISWHVDEWYRELPNARRKLGISDDDESRGAFDELIKALGKNPQDW